MYLKFENHQFTAAYKERGALNRLLLLDAEARAKGVVAASAGNHAQGLAYHGKRLGVPVTIVMPQTTPTVKVMQTEGHGATVILFGESSRKPWPTPRELETARGLTFVHAFDEPDVIAGQGTVALEMLEDAPDIDTLVIPIGGGGLFSGMATAARALKPDIQLIGVQAELYPSMYDYVKQANLPCDGDTLAEGIAVKEPGLLTRRFVSEMANDVVLVTERALEQAVSLLLQIEKTVVEDAGAAGLAALIEHKAMFAGRKIGLVLCGGNIDTRLLANVLLRDLARSGRLRAPAHSPAGSARRPLPRRPHLPRGTGQHHRGLSPARVHLAARQRPHHRHRMRDARRGTSPAPDRRARICGLRGNASGAGLTTAHAA